MGWGWSDTCDDWLVKLMIIIIYSDILQNAPFHGQIFKIFFASGGKGALTPPNKNPADADESYSELQC